MIDEINYSNIMSIGAYGRYNYNFAKLFGLELAVYFEELLSQSFASKNEKSFIPKASQVETLTGFDKDKQESLMSVLKDAGLVEQSGREVHINVDVYMSTILKTPDDATIDKYRKLVTESALKPANKKEKKIEAVKNNLRSNVVGNNVELRKLYFKWIDALVDRFGCITVDTVIFGQRLASQEANGSTAIETAIVEKAILNCYRDMSWAVKAYKDTLTISGNLGSAKPITITGSPKTSETHVEEQAKPVFGDVI